MIRNNLEIPLDPVADFCRRNHIRKLAVYGSALRQDSRPDSDMDLLVEFEKGHVPGLLGMAALEQELSVVLGGRKIDMRTAEDLSPYFRSEVMASAKVQYAQE